MLAGSDSGGGVIDTLASTAYTLKEKKEGKAQLTFWAQTLGAKQLLPLALDDAGLVSQEASSNQLLAG